MSSEPIILLSTSEIEKMRRVGKLAGELLVHLGKMVAPGVTTQAINDEAERWTRERGARSAPLNYAPGGCPPYPRSICTSVNEVVCHGIPTTKKILKEGDIINIDVTLILDGYHGDTSRTFFVGTPSKQARQLVEVTEKCLQLGIAEVAPGKRLGDIGAAIAEYAESFGYGVVREFVGHGIGKNFHTAPQVFHFGERGKGVRMQPGMAFTIEPMINQGTWKTRMLDDEWTAVTKDNKLSAQFEHTILVTETGVEILTLPGTAV
ncbi:MAG: type I methionyl aminopeptidase [Myxococcota bacterium]